MRPDVPVFCFLFSVYCLLFTVYCFMSAFSFRGFSQIFAQNETRCNALIFAGPYCPDPSENGAKNYKELVGSAHSTH